MKFNKYKKLFNSLLILEFVLLMGFLYYSPLVLLERIIAIIVLLYLNIVLYISKNNKISELLGFITDNDYYQTYLNIVIDTLKIADKEIYKVNLIGDDSDYRIKNCIEIVYSCTQYLKTIDPPQKYNKYHKNILKDLDSFLNSYSF